MLNFESVNCDGKHINWEFNTLEKSTDCSGRKTVLSPPTTT